MLWGVETQRALLNRSTVQPQRRSRQIPSLQAQGRKETPGPCREARILSCTAILPFPLTGEDPCDACASSHLFPRAAFLVQHHSRYGRDVFLLTAQQGSGRWCSGQQEAACAHRCVCTCSGAQPHGHLLWSLSRLLQASHLGTATAGTVADELEFKSSGPLCGMRVTQAAVALTRECWNSQ